MATALEFSQATNGSRRRLRNDRHEMFQVDSRGDPADFDLETIQRAIRMILRALGENPDRTGLSKLARVVDEVARRPPVQERMTQTIADMIERKLESTGVAIVVQAEHSCMSIRGVKKHGSSTVTSALLGIFKSNQSSRAEVLSLVKQNFL